MNKRMMKKQNRDLRRADRFMDGKMKPREAAKYAREYEWKPAHMADSYNEQHYDLYFNNNGTYFKPRKLLWWDDASYAAYQGSDFMSPEDEEFILPYTPICHKCGKVKECKCYLPVEPTPNSELPF